MSDDTQTEETTRGRGRPSMAELNDRAAALKEREEALAVREREAELAAAEANAALREAELTKMEAMTTVAAGRTGSARTDDIREDLTQPVRARRRFRGEQMPNEFHIADEDIPGDTSYQWNNYTVFGQTNPSSEAFMAMQGWEPVPASRHPHLVQKGADPNGPIVVKGQILVQRPKELTREALREDYQRAIGEVQRKEEQLYGTPAGTMPRSRANGSNEFNRVIKTVERPAAPPKTNYQYENTGPVIE